MTTRKKSQSSAITKPAITEDGLELIDDNGIVSNELESVSVETRHLNTTSKKVLVLLQRFHDGKSETEVVADILNAWVEQHFKQKVSRSKMLVEDTLEQVQVEHDRIEREMKAATRRIAEQKYEELENISVQIRHFAG